jgi:hypothetical protein
MRLESVGKTAVNNGNRNPHFWTMIFLVDTDALIVDFTMIIFVSSTLICYRQTT